MDKLKSIFQSGLKQGQTEPNGREKWSKCVTGKADTYKCTVQCPKFERTMNAIILPDKLETEATEKGDDKIQ